MWKLSCQVLYISVTPPDMVLLYIEKEVILEARLFPPEAALLGSTPMTQYRAWQSVWVEPTEAVTVIPRR